MHPEDNVFFEEYKRLDRLCSDIYSCSNGVSAYISEMERKEAQGLNRIPCWNSDYKTLKRLRWIRNKIAHDPDNNRISEPDDLRSVREYYERIVSGKDSLTLLRRALEADKRKAEQNAVRKPVQSVQEDVPRSGNTDGGEYPVWIGYLIGFCLLALIIAAFYYFLR